MSDSISENKSDIIKLIIDESRYRPLVPFVGSGISISAGYPTIILVTQYLAKVKFAIHLGVFRDRFPVVQGGKESLVREYRQHPSKYIEDFGWPELGQLDADLWSWIKWLNGDDSIKAITPRDKENIFKTLNNEEDNLLLDLSPENKLDYRDSLKAIVQWTLRRELANQEGGTKDAVKEQWGKWKKWYSGNYFLEKSAPNKSNKPQLLFGDWESLLDSLCEGDFDLVDNLFNQLEKGLTPAISHRLLSFLQLKLGIPLVLTTNFDSLLEQAFRGEGLRPAVFDIHKDADLPSSDLVRKQLSILKLHGSAYGLRYGERLKQRLGIGAENIANQYLPDNALVLVLGFSGSERRMMQMLQSFVHSHRNETNKTRLVWIKGPGDLGPLAKELRETDNNLVKSCEVRHADTFLQDLYFNIANSHQASRKHYTSLPGQLRMTELELDPVGYDGEKRANHRKPVQCFLANQGSKNPSGSWATLAGVAFTNSLDSSYKVIWIDMEHYQSVQGVVSEFFYQVRRLDPKAPSCNISGLNFDTYGEKNTEKENSEQNKEIDKIVERISEVFQRGQYVLAFDSLESFGRPPMDHHGIPTKKSNPNSQYEAISFNRFIKEIRGLYKLLGVLLLNKDKEKFYGDSYIVLTIEKPRARHPQREPKEDNESLKAIKNHIDDLKKIATKQEHIFLVPQTPEKDNKKTKEELNYDDFNKVLKKIIEQKENNIPDFDNFSEDWLYSFESSITFNRAEKRAKSVLKLFKDLSNKPETLNQLIKETKETKETKESDQDIKHIVSAFVTLLAFFRQPRTIPMLHSIIQRWILREGEGNTSEKEERATEVHKTIHHLIERMSPRKEDESNIPKVGQKHEGGSVWLYREVHESTYNAQTEFLHRKSWISHKSDDSESEKCVAAMLDGMIFVSWHLLIARTYYVDIFLPTKDIKSFYEYLYHRVTAIRTISLLLYIFNIVVEKGYSDSFFKKIDSIYVSTEKLNNGENNAFFEYIKDIGFFSQIPEHKRYTEEENKIDFFRKNIEALYFNSLETLLSSLKRNQLTFLAQSAPDTVDAWSNQFLYVDLIQMSGIDLLGIDWSKIRNNYSQKKPQDYIDRNHNLDQSLKNDLKKIYSLFEEFFAEQMLYAGIARLNFKHANNSAIQKDILEIYHLKDKHETKKKYDDWLNSINSKEEVKQYIKFMRCYLFIDYGLVNWLADLLDKKVCEFQETLNENEISLLVRDLFSLKGKALIIQWPFWQPLLDRELPKGDDAVKNLLKVEKASIAYEDTLRMTAKTSEEDAYHRSTAFCLRARSLYLQGHFSEAHHFLDVASTGLLSDRVDHRVKASVINLVRAELLSTSAEKKYDDCLKSPDDQKRDGDKFKSKQLSELHTSLKKIKRANQELIQAERLLQDIAHEKMWLVILEFGFAQLQLEEILFGMELLELENKEMNKFKFLKENGSLERSILEGMQRLRNVLDLIPFDTNYWEGIESERKEKLSMEDGSNHFICYPMLITIERMCYKLWKHFFVVGGYYSRLLNIQYHSRKNGTASTTYSVFGDKRYGERWLNWCHSMRFPKLGKSVLNFTSIYSENSKVLSEEDYFVESSSIRALVIEIMKEGCEDKINQMWNARRNN